MSDDTLYFLKSWAAGGIANAITSALLNPLDVAKTRMQTALQGNRGMVATLCGMWAQGGLLGIYRPGLAASCIREMLSSGPRAGMYVPLRDYATTRTGLPPDSSLLKIVVAMGCGFAGSVIANPIDVVKVRSMSASANGSLPQSTMRLVQACWRNEGLGGMYKGLVPSTLRGCFIAAGELATYDIAKTYLKAHIFIATAPGSNDDARLGGPLLRTCADSGRTRDEGGEGGEGMQVHVAASLITGVVAACVASPFDVLKTLHMNSSDSSGISVARLVAAEGPRVLFRGLVPSYCRLGPHALICFPLFEQARRVLGLDFV